MKLPLVVVTRTYELTYLLPVTYTDSELTKLNDGVVAGLKKRKATILNTEIWGKRQLAYKLKHSGKFQTDAHYVHLVFEAPSAAVQAMEKDIYLQPEIMRHLLVVAEPATEQKPQVEGAKQAE